MFWLRRLAVCCPTIVESVGSQLANFTPPPPPPAYLPSPQHQPTRRTRRNLPLAESWPSFKHLIVRQEIGAKTVGTRIYAPPRHGRCTLIWCRRWHRRDICLFVRRLECEEGGAHTNAHNTILAAAPEDSSRQHTHGSCYMNPEQGFQYIHGMAWQNFLQHMIWGPQWLQQLVFPTHKSFCAPRSFCPYLTIAAL